MIFSVDRRDVMVTLQKQSLLRLERSVCFHLKMDMVSIMAAGEQKGLREWDWRVVTMR